MAKVLWHPLRSWDTFAILFLAIWTPLYFLPVASGQQVFDNGDISQFSLPAGLALAHALAEGRLPLWEPAMQAGFPLLAAENATALYPISLILYRFLPVTMALSYSILFHLVWASLGMYVLARVSGLGVPSAWLSGFTFGFGGFALAHITHLALTITAAWLPWLILFQEQFWRAWLARRQAWLWLCLSSMTIGLQLLGGFLEFAVYSIAIFALFGLVSPFLEKQTTLVRSYQRTTLRLAQAAWFTIFPIILGIGIAAVQLLPTMELTEYSIRSQAMDPEFVTGFSLAPGALTQFISPFWWNDKPDVSNQEFWAYLGVVSILLAVSAPLQRRTAHTWLLFAMAVLALFLALGGSNPLFAFVSDIPILNRFRVPARFLYIFVFTASWLAGIGLDELRRHLSDSAQCQLIARVCGAVFGLLALGAIWLNSQQSIEWLNAWQVLPGIFMSVGLTVMIFAWKQAINRSIFTVAILGSLLLDLTLFAFPFLSTIATMSPPSELMTPPPSISTMDTTQPMYRLFTNVYNETLRPNHPMVYDKQSAQIYHPLQLQKSEDYLNQLSPPMLNLMNVRYYVLPSGPLPEEFTEPTASVILDLFRDNIDISPTRVVQVQVTSYTDKTSDILNDFLAGEITLTSSDGRSLVLPLRMGSETADWAYEGLDDVKHSQPNQATAFPGYLISVGHAFNGFKYTAQYNIPIPFDIVTIAARSYLPQGELIIERVVFVDETGHSISLAALAHRNDFAVVFKSQAVTELENSDMLPRAFVVHEAQLVDDAQVLTRMRVPDWAPDQLVFLAEGQPLSLREERVDKRLDQVAITNYQPEKIEISVTAEEAGYLVLADTWYPGWEAWVDGAKTSIYRADYIFRAVPLQRGQHSIVFEYHPLAFVMGGLISGLCLLAVASLAVPAFRERINLKISER